MEREADRCDLLCLDLPRAEAVRARQPDADTLAGAAARAKAVSDPTRLSIATALRGGEELCVCDLAWVTGRSEQLVSHHARLLRTAGLLASRREGRMVMYRLTGQGAQMLAAVLPAQVRA